MQNKLCHRTTSGHIFMLSFFGAFIFWCFTGVLTSILTVKNYSLPANSLDDITNSKYLKLFTPKGGSTQSLLIDWANKKPQNGEAYEHFIEPYLLEEKDIENAIHEVIREAGTAMILPDDNFQAYASESKK